MIDRAVVKSDSDCHESENLILARW
jgi:hypothetical protein